MAVDLNEQLTGQLAAIANQGVADNQRLAQNTLLAYQKDLFQGGQGEAPVLFAGMNTADRTPIVKAGG
jgi:hypothetical protein